VSWRRLWLFLWGPTLDDLIPIKAASEPPTDRNVIASEAKRLLEDPVLLLALQRMQQRLVETWKSTGTADTAAREEMYRLHWAIEELRAELQRMIDNARVLSGVAREQ
jgi:hypothetical protein